MSDETIERSLGSLDAKLDAVLSAMIEFKSEVRTKSSDFERRVRDIEMKQSWVAGMAAAVGIIASLAAGWVKEHLK